MYFKEKKTKKRDQCLNIFIFSTLVIVELSAVVFLRVVGDYRDLTESAVFLNPCPLGADVSFLPGTLFRSLILRDVVYISVSQ